MGGMFAITSETSILTDAGNGSTSATGCKVCFLFSCDCDVSLMTLVAETFLILEGVFAAGLCILSVSRQIL